MTYTKTNSSQPADAPAVRRALPGRLWLGVSLFWGLLISCLLPMQAHATCNFNKGTTQSTVTFALPGSLTLPTNPPLGSQTVLWTSSTAYPQPVAEIHCNGATNSGIQGQIGGLPYGNTLFPTGITNLYFQILYAGDPMPAYPDYSVAWPDELLNQPFTLQLIAMGPISTDQPLNAGPLAQWVVDMGSGITPIVAFKIGNPVTFAPPACNDPAVTVVLPTVLTSVFNQQTGFTTGKTPFNLQFTCSSAVAPSITLATSSPQIDATGVIAPTTGTGYAQDVGVQILDQGGLPVTFGKPITTGSGTSTSFNVLFYAQYYQIGTPVTAGQVHAVATYTLTYQ